MVSYIFEWEVHSLKKIVFLSFFSLLLFSSSLKVVAADEAFIIINKRNNQLAYYENNQVNQIFQVATGQSASLTPEGSFKIVNKIVDRPYYKEKIPGGDPTNPLGRRWLGLDARGTWGTTYAIHGNNNPASIGRYVSLGCIRMHNAEVEWLFEQVEIGTPVIIVSSMKPFDTIAAEHDFDVVVTSLGSEPVMTNTVLKYGSSGEEVKELQQSLTKLHYYTDSISGVFGEVTHKAVIAFQKDHGLIVDGLVGPQTKRALHNPPEKVEPIPTTEEIVLDNLLERSPTEHELELQKLGYYLGPYYPVIANYRLMLY